MSYVDLSIRIDPETTIAAVEDIGASRFTTTRYDSQFETSTRLTVWLGCDNYHDTPATRIAVIDRLAAVLAELRAQAQRELDAEATPEPEAVAS